MDAIPALVPISDLRLRQNEIITGLPKGPVVLTQHGRAAAVLVSPEQWNQLVEKLAALEEALEEAEDVRAVEEIEVRIADAEEPILEWSEVEAESTQV